MVQVFNWPSTKTICNVYRFTNYNNWTNLTCCSWLHYHIFQMNWRRNGKIPLVCRILLVIHPTCQTEVHHPKRTFLADTSYTSSLPSQNSTRDHMILLREKERMMWNYKNCNVNMYKTFYIITNYWIFVHISPLFFCLLPFSTICWGVVKIYVYLLLDTWYLTL